jgi:two-component system, NtrC family, sensor kinase
LPPEVTENPARPDAELPAVLVVDDVDANLVAMEALLDALPCRLVRASSGAQALKLLLQTDFAVMLLDVQMPGMDGFEVARHARSRASTREVPIIFVTAAYSSEEYSLRGYGTGAVDFLFKPIVRDVLQSKVRVFLELYESRRRLARANTLLEGQNRELLSLAAEEASMSSQLRATNADLRRAYTDLQQAQAQLVQSARLAAVSELIAGVSYEINDPLAFVMSHLGTASRALSQLEPPAGGAPAPESGGLSKATTRIQDAMEGLERIRELLLKLRVLVHLDEGKREPISIASCFDSVLSVVRPRLVPSIRLEVALGPPHGVECYPALLGQLLLILVNNALDALDGAGVLTLRSGMQEGRLVISVADSGHGIPEELRERICEPFFTTKVPGKGVGLGLAMAESIAAKHYGKLSFLPRAGGGTVVELSLPRSTAVQRPSLASPTPS